MPGTRKLGRTSDHRKAMLRGMVTFLLENGQIETTVTRAKEVRAVFLYPALYSLLFIVVRYTHVIWFIPLLKKDQSPVTGAFP